MEESEESSRPFHSALVGCLQQPRSMWSLMAKYEGDHSSEAGAEGGLFKTLAFQWRTEGQEGVWLDTEEKHPCGHREGPKQRPGCRDLGEGWDVGTAMGGEGWRGRQGLCAMLRSWHLFPLHQEVPLQGLIWERAGLLCGLEISGWPVSSVR